MLTLLQSAGGLSDGPCHAWRLLLVAGHLDQHARLVGVLEVVVFAAADVDPAFTMQTPNDLPRVGLKSHLGCPPSLRRKYMRTAGPIQPSVEHRFWNSAHNTARGERPRLSPEHRAMGCVR